MRLRIHHGAVQVGGNCIELESEGERLLLDLGLPLDAEPRVPEVAGILDHADDLLGVVLSHPHLDHYDLLPFVRPDLPVWLGEDARRMLDAAAPFTPSGALPQKIIGYRAKQTLEIGSFRIMPFLMDHSAYDSHALLVEAGGRRLFYSGDFRGHGRKAAIFEEFLKSAPTNIDLLLMEGTTLGRSDDEVGTETDVESQSTSIMHATSGMVLACFSAQNVDRFVSFYRASVRAGRIFVMDAYLANLFAALGLQSLPDPATSPRVRVFLPSSQKRQIVKAEQFDLVNRYRSNRIYADELARHPERFTMLFRASMVRDLATLDLKNGSLIYSLWPGYLDRDRVDLRQWAREREVSFHLIHSSGHAHPTDLRRMAAALKPARLMPIHSAHPERYEEIYPCIQRSQNGEWVEV